MVPTDHRRGSRMSEGTRYTKNSQKQQRACALYRGGATLDAIVKNVRIDFYRLRVALDREGLLPYPDEDKPVDRCPCGKLTGVPKQMYCSHEHRMQYGTFRQKDPANWVTFNCLGCGVEVTRPKNYGGNLVQKYCSNGCSAKHNRTRKFYAVEDLEIIFESSFECLFWALCMLWKIPVDRADRGLAVPVNGDGWYCPDFYLPEQHTWVEVKGFEDDDDRARYAAWRTVVPARCLAVVDRDGLHELCASPGASDVLRRLIDWSMTGP